MSETNFEPITSQEQLDSILKSRLARAEETFSKKYADYDDVKNRATKLEEELKTLKSTYNDLASGSAKEIEQLGLKIKGYETQSVKQRIALESGLPLEVANRLNGETEDDIRKDADFLVKMLGTTRVAPLASTEGAVDSDTQAYKQMLGKLMNK